MFRHPGSRCTHLGTSLSSRRAMRKHLKWTPTLKRRSKTKYKMQLKAHKTNCWTVWHLCWILAGKNRREHVRQLQVQNEEQHKHNQKVFIKMREASGQLDSDNLTQDNVSAAKRKISEVWTETHKISRFLWCWVAGGRRVCV